MNLEESYRALGLKQGATLQEVRLAYRERMKFFHPDLHQASPGLLHKATEATKKLNLAYESVCKVFGVNRSSAGATAEKRKAKTSSARSSGKAPTGGETFIVPSCGMKLNWVGAGRFQMGSPDQEAGRSNDEGPRTEVTISRGFWVGTYPVTQEEWKAAAEDASGLNAEPSYFRGDRLPVEQVSWNDCELWLQELNTLEAARLPHGFTYRLPTEAEWEFVCRAGTPTRFHCGSADGALDEHAWFSTNSRSQTHVVGEKKANAWGFHDMHGNVWEWCGDWYGPLPGGAVTDPKGAVFGVNKVFRGGSWGVAAARCRSAYRVWNKPDYRDYTVGFRVALAPQI